MAEVGRLRGMNWVKTVFGLMASVACPVVAAATPSYTAVFLPTAGYTSSSASNIANGQIVGYSSDPVFHALVWPDLSSQPIDLNPAGSINSQVVATDGVTQI